MKAAQDEVTRAFIKQEHSAVLKAKAIAASMREEMKRPVGRPKTITDMRAYKAAKAREYRAKKKAETNDH